MTVADDGRIDESDEPVRIRASQSLCEGWGNCRRWAPEVYFLDDEGEIGFQFLEVPHELIDAAWLGADACPAQAIQVLGKRPPWRTSSSTPVAIASTEVQ